MAIVGALPQDPMPTGKQSHGWTRRMNINLILMSLAFNPAAKSFVSSLPASADIGDCYILSTDGRMYIWVDALSDQDGDDVPAGFWSWQPKLGTLVMVEDQEKMYLFNWANQWEMVLDLNAVHIPLEREFAFYIPGPVEANDMIFRYIAGLEFTVEAGAPNSGATLDIAPSSTVVFSLRRQGAQFGTITFSTGSLNGVVSVPSEVVIQPSHVENMYVKANEMSIHSPANLYGAEGLQLTLRGKIRPID